MVRARVAGHVERQENVFATIPMKVCDYNDHR
eukprot:SAG31_NODE_18_length_35375_cov_22.525315_8_plen_32_part_00